MIRTFLLLIAGCYVTVPRCAVDKASFITSESAFSIVVATHSESDKPEIVSCRVAEAFVSCGLKNGECGGVDDETRVTYGFVSRFLVPVRPSLYGTGN